MAAQKDNPSARYVITYTPTRSWFYKQPAQTARVRGDEQRRVTTAAIRDAGGSVLKVRRVSWLGF